MRKFLLLNGYHFAIIPKQLQNLKEGKTIKIILLFMLTFFTFSEVYSQLNDDWTLSAEQDGVKIYHQISACDDEPIVLLKFLNENSDSVKVEWNEYVKLSGLEEEIKVSPYIFSLDLATGQIQADNCVELKILQLVSRPNRFYSIFHTDQSDTSIVPSVPKWDIESYRISIINIIKQ